MVQFQKYDSYKDSGESWIGDCPEHWETKKLKRLFREKKHRTNMELNCGAISFGEVVEKDDERVPLATKASYQEVLAGEFLVNPLNLNYDLKSLRIGLSEIDVVVSAGYIVLQATVEELDKRYYKYLLHRYDVANMKLFGSGVRQTINFNHIANSILLFPSIGEQKRIAAFLDEKTTKIDQAVSIKEQQIALLKERKQIVIQEAVTKGLNPNAPMKDSGIEWIGEVPVHWVVDSLGSILLPVSEKNHPDKPLLSVTREQGVIVRDVEDQEGNHNFIPDDLSGYKLVRAGQFAMNKMKAWQGSYGISQYSGIVSPAYFVFSLLKKFDAEFFNIAIRSKLYVTFFGQASDGVRIGQWDLNKTRMKAIHFAYPDIEEQREIVKHINLNLAKVEAAIELKERQIEAMKEYRTSLINEAVTGKIKVV